MGAELWDEMETHGKPEGGPPCSCFNCDDCQFGELGPGAGLCIWPTGQEWICKPGPDHGQCPGVPVLLLRKMRV